ncbi:MAG: efflux RND transporter periplasmic adaptor subunit [Gammaproteobacteria bacterium]|nr:efflux RND transporter periplasmic adaptor subunit [Gammaproteobacteria bacterium]
MNEPPAPPPAPMRRSRSFWVAAGLLGTLVVVVGLRLIGSKAPPRAMPPQVVDVAAAVRASMPETLTELGTVTPISTVTVLPQLSGYLTEVGYREGEDVKAGQFLAQIDPRPYAIGLRQAEAALAKDRAVLAQGRADLARYALLRTKQAIAEQTYDDQRYAVEQQRAQVASDQANAAQYRLDLAYAHITAPIAGRVGLRLVDPGNYVTASSSPGIVVITTMKPTTVEFTVAQNDLAAVVRRFDTGAKLEVTATTSGDDRPIETGMLYAIGNQVSTGTGTVTLRAKFANAQERLFPNEFVNVKLLVDTLRNVVTVPTSAILNGAPGDYVYLVGPDHTVSAHPVRIGPSDGERTAILAGLAPGQVVVIDGTDRLRDGARISIASGAAQRGGRR